MDGEIKLTPFNMTEEQEDGHFDADGHFQWNRNKNEVRDNWLDNLEWVQPKAIQNRDDNASESSSSESDDDDEAQTKRPIKRPKKSSESGASTSTSSSSSATRQFDVIDAYRRILELMQPGETIKRTLQRLGGKSTRMSSAERWRQKRAGIVDPNAALVVELTELANAILTKLGNMDVYEETFDGIRDKYAAKTTVPTTTAAKAEEDELDMYADDFVTKEKTVIASGSSFVASAASATAAPTATAASAAYDANVMKPPTAKGVVQFADKQPTIEDADDVMWEFKWTQSDEDEVHTGFTSAQMQRWVEEGYFKTGVFVRKCGQTEASFNSSNRIDFELYL